jgi:hypothetical protein
MWGEKMRSIIIRLLAPSILFYSSACSAALNFAGKDCSVECAKGGSPFCLKTRADGGTLQQSFSSLFKRLSAMNEHSPIGAAELRQMFLVKEDPCHRSDTTLSGALLRNEGGECILKTQLPIAGASAPVKMEVLIPEKLVLSFVKVGERLEFRPAEGLERALFFNISDDLLQADWGGHILAASINAKSATITTVQGCIGMSLK